MTASIGVASTRRTSDAHSMRYARPDQRASLLHCVLHLSHSEEGRRAGLRNLAG